MMLGAPASAANEAMLITRPRFCRTSHGTKARQPRTTPSRLMLSIHCHSAMSASRMLPPEATPALLTTTSIESQTCSSEARRASTEASSPTSTLSAWWPEPGSSASVSCARSGTMSAQATA